MSYRQNINTTKFSIYLKNLFERNGESVAAVARSIGAERTSIHKALSGERLLPYHVVHALADHFQLSLDEQQEFFRLYDILLQGEGVWQNRTAVASLINYLSTIQFQTTASHMEAVNITQMYENTPVQGELAVLNMVNTILYSEIMQNDNPTFLLFLPPDMDLSHVFINQWLIRKHFHVEQLLSISSVSGDNSARNVQLLKQIIPLSLTSGGLYRSYHFHEIAGSSYINPLNYYIITPHYLILLKQDQSVAYVQRNETLIDVYSEHFRTLIERCNPLVSYGQNIAELFDMANTTIDTEGYLYLMTQPCFGRYYTPDIISRYFQVQNCPIPGMFDAAVQHFAMLQKVEKNFCTVFSEKGLQYFIETGIVTEMPPEYIPPAQVADRIHLLSRLRKDIAEGTITGLIARPSYLKLPDYLSMSIDSNGDTHFDTTSAFPSGAFSCNIHISEKSIRQAFKDFFTSLPGSQMVYSQEDTLKMLDDVIRKLSGKNPT